MNEVERDDLAHALGQTLAFYNKKMEKNQFSFWLDALRDKPMPAIKQALLDYVKIGKFAPKPVDIIELLNLNREQIKAHVPLALENTTKCPPKVARAWSWFINHHATVDLGLPREDITPEEQDEYLLIVNREAKKYNQPEAIPDEFKLKEVWC